MENTNEKCSEDEKSYFHLGCFIIQAHPLEPFWSKTDTTVQVHHRPIFHPIGFPTETSCPSILTPTKRPPVFSSSTIAHFIWVSTRSIIERSNVVIDRMRGTISREEVKGLREMERWQEERGKAPSSSQLKPELDYEVVGEKKGVGW